MAQVRRVPGRARDNPDRIQSRGADGFARFPAEEAHHIRMPGEGPRGPLDGSTQWPIVVIVVGFAALFLTFFVGTWWPLVAGLVLIAVGGGWNHANSDAAGGSFSGSGPVRIEETADTGSEETTSRS